MATVNPILPLSLQHLAMAGQKITPAHMGEMIAHIQGAYTIQHPGQAPYLYPSAIDRFDAFLSDRRDAMTDGAHDIARYFSRYRALAPQLLSNGRVALFSG